MSTAILEWIVLAWVHGLTVGLLCGIGLASIARMKR